MHTKRQWGHKNFSIISSSLELALALERVMGTLNHYKIVKKVLTFAHKRGGGDIKNFSIISSSLELALVLELALALELATISVLSRSAVVF